MGGTHDKEVTVFLGAYHFDGETRSLLDGYDRLAARFPPGVLQLNVCVARDDGMTVFDACPSRAVFAEFARSPEFLGAVSAAGLPTPRVELLGDVHAATVASGVNP
jgi:hypothetical protein